MRRPATRAGQELRSLLLPKPGIPTGKLLGEAVTVLLLGLPGGGFARVAEDTLTLSIRRCLTGWPRADTARFARDALVRAGEDAEGRLCHAVEATVRAGLGETPVLDGIGGIVLAKAQLLLLRDIVQASAMTPDQLDELIAHAELYRRRHFAPQAATSITSSARWLLSRRRRPRNEGTAPDVSDGGGRHEGPRSLAGQKLRAAVINDQDILRRTPDDPRDDDALAVLDAFFELLMRRLFRAGYEARDVTQFVQGVVRRMAHGTPLPTTDMEAVVRSKLGEPIPIDGGPDRRSVAVVKMIVSRAATIDLALFDRELGELLVEAERLAGERGFAPTLASTEGSGEPTT